MTIALAPTAGLDRQWMADCFLQVYLAVWQHAHNIDICKTFRFMFFLRRMLIRYPCRLLTK